MKEPSATGLKNLKEYRLKISLDSAVDKEIDQYKKSILDSQEFCQLWKLIGERMPFLELRSKCCSCTSSIQLLYNNLPNLKHFKLLYVMFRSILHWGKCNIQV